MARKDDLPVDFDPEKFLDAVLELCRVLHEIFQPIAQRINEAFMSIEDFDALYEEEGDFDGEQD
jgi:hypothetical protein